MSAATRRSVRSSPLWLVLITALLALRLPAFVEPVGNDQSLYLYAADRIRAGGVPYLDAWDQKPPAVAFVYAALGTVWPWPSSTVAFGDLLAASLTAWLLVVLGRRFVDLTTGYLAASTFLLLGHPSIARLGGIYQRGQCEVFIALAVTAAIVLVWPRARRSVLGGRRPVSDHEVRWPLALAGVSLAAAFWLKYNALVYALPVLVALVARPTASSDRHARLRETVWVAAGFGALSLIVLGYFGARHAIHDLRLATIDYNLQYSGETYSDIRSALAYVVTLPFSRAKADLLWYVGGVGAALLIVLGRARPATLLTCAWIAAATISIALNGARGLPQYFVQAAPALALAFAVGIGVTVQRGRAWTIIATLLIIAGLWKVGVEAPLAAGIRLGGLPQLVANVGFDLQFARGRVDRATYLARFKGEQKYDAVEVDALAALVRDTTGSSDRILVFGFAPAIYVQSGRVSASRFFWSRPVILEFASDTPGYGSRGLLADLEASKPAMVILQKQDWRPDATDSMEFFLTTPILSHWLLTGYALEQDTPLFTVWRRNP